MSIRSVVLSALIFAVLLLGTLLWMNRRTIDRLHQEVGERRVEVLNLQLILKRQDDQMDRLLRVSQDQAKKAALAATEARKARLDAEHRVREIMAQKPATNDLCVEAERLIDSQQ